MKVELDIGISRNTNLSFVGLTKNIDTKHSINFKNIYSVRKDYFLFKSWQLQQLLKQSKPTYQLLGWDCTQLPNLYKIQAQEMRYTNLMVTLEVHTAEIN